MVTCHASQKGAQEVEVVLKPCCFAQGLIIWADGMLSFFRKPQRKGSASFNLHTYLTEARLWAWVLVHTAGWTTVTAGTGWVTLVAKLAAIAFSSCVTFFAWTLTWPFPWEEKNGNDPSGRERCLKQRSANYICEGPESKYFRLFGQSLMLSSATVP